MAINWQKYKVTKIIEATSYQDALQKAIDERPNIAIVDIRIEDKWGYDLVNALKQFKLQTHFIMMSGYDNFEYVHQSLLVGAKDYLLKPINYLELQRIIGEIIVDELKGAIDDSPAMENDVDPILKKKFSELSKLINRMIAIVHSEYNKNINLIYVAELFKMNNRYIGQVFLLETGMKFSEYLLSYRMIVARDLIINTKEKITYIAMRVGYNNTNYFYQHFKNHFGFSPSDLRFREEEN